MVLKAVVLGGIVPGILATLFLGAVWWPRRRTQTGGARWALPMVAALALLPAEVLVRAGMPALWPAAGADRMLHAGALALLAGLLEGVAGGRTWAAAVLRILGAGAALWITLGVRIPAFWTVAEGAAWISGFAILTGAAASMIDRAGRGAGAPTAIALFIPGAILPVVLLESGLAHLAQVGGGLAAALGAAALIACLVRPFTPSGGGVSVCVILLATLLLCGHYYAPDGIPLAQSLLLAVSPLAALATLARPVPRLGRLKQCAIVAGLSALPALAAAILALTTGSAGTDDYYG